MQKSTNDYFLLRKDIDGQIEILEKEHKRHLSCKCGCDLCCMDYNIFPVEFYSILKELQEQKFKPHSFPAKKESNSCVFLKDHKCSIYRLRPIICRTHGLPLLYTNDNDEWELSTCELNFTDYDFGQFSEENTYAQDRFNSKLFILNRNFIANFKDTNFKETDLIPLKKLTEYL